MDPERADQLLNAERPRIARSLAQRVVPLHPLTILLALTGGAIVAGALGALLAVPITAVVWTVCTARAGKGRSAAGGLARTRPTWSGS